MKLYISSNDDITRFMSNRSFYEFKLDGEMWKSVEHYVIFWKYTKIPKITDENTNLSIPERYTSQDIKSAETFYELLYIANTFSHGAYSEQDYIKMLNRCIYAKFMQNYQLQILLLQTFNLKLKSDECEFSAKIISSVREKLLSEENVYLLKNVPCSFSETDRLFIEKLLGILHRLPRIELVKKIYPEMVFDAFMNMYTTPKTSKIQQIEFLVTNMFIDDSDVYNDFASSFMKLHKTIVNIVMVMYASGTHEFHRNTFLVLRNIAFVFQIYKNSKDLFEVGKIIQSKDIHLPKIKRGYRR